MKKIAVWSLIISVGMIFGFCLENNVVAKKENVVTMTVSPMTQRLALTPGESTRASLKISVPNNATSELEYSLSVGSFSVQGTDLGQDDYGDVDLETKGSYNQIMDWIVFDKESGVIAPNNTETINFTINVPRDAPSGGQYATILVRDMTGYKEGSNGINIQSITQIASVVYANVEGNTRRTGEILENNVPAFLLNSKLKATSMVENTGNVDTNARYILQVWPLFSDEEICTNEENASTELVLPGTRKYHVEKCDLPSIGIFRVKQTVEIFEEKSETQEKILIVCPIWLAFIVFVAIIALILYFCRKIRAKRRKKVLTR